MIDVKYKIGVIGLGYVGLPLAVAFGEKFETIGFDINSRRVDELKDGIDITSELSNNEISLMSKVFFTDNIEDLKECNIYIVTVPTPIDKDKKPCLKPLISASEMVGQVISIGDIVIYESTVYPGATEDDCIPVIEQKSGLRFNIDFYAGYSPERINPGDKTRNVKDILKITSGSTPDIAECIDKLYRAVIDVGTYKASSIKVAEAAKVVENVQRDVNISLINEFHQIFTHLGISTREVIDAASTKWNFMRLYPGLVGGHCIGIDPYYLLYKSESSGYIPDLIRTAREINDSMVEYLVQDFLRKLLEEKINPIGLKIIILGITFKENCPDIRNTRVWDLYNRLIALGFDISIYDPIANENEVSHEYGIKIEKELNDGHDVAILAVKHKEIINNINYIKSLMKESYVYDFCG